jgi:hypothetical protein
MKWLRDKFRGSPIYVRVAPFVIFLAITCLPSLGVSQYWAYLAKTVVGAWLVWEMRPFVPEMRFAVSWEAVVVGVLVFVMWVGLDPYYVHAGGLWVKLGVSQTESKHVLWNPGADFGPHSGLAWLFLVTRVAGMTLVVPPLEEVFYRSFLYRYFVRTNFTAMPLFQFHATSFIVTALLFGFEHEQWLAGVLCGIAYHWLVFRRKRLGDAMTAHAITNCILGVWSIWRGAWQFY